MTSELLSEVKQAYYILKRGGPPRKIVEILVAFIEGALSVCFILQEGAREQIETEVEYLLDKLGRSSWLETGFILKRFRGLFRNLLRDKRIVPRIEVTFTSLLPSEGDKRGGEERSWEERLFNMSVDWGDFKMEIPQPVPYQPQEKTFLRKLRLYSLKHWEIGVFLQEEEKKPKKLVQRGLFD